MNIFLKKTALFAIVLLITSQIFYLFINISPRLEADKRLEKLITGEINKEIIVFGSSRGARNIIAGQIEDSISSATYNLSYPGSNIIFHEFLLHSLLKFNEKPKIILLAVDGTELLYDRKLNFRFERLYPLVKYDYINEEMIKRGEKNFLSRYFVLSKINRSNMDITKKRFSELDTLRECGSMPISFQKEDSELVYKDITSGYNSQYEIPEKVIAFNNFRDICLKNNIRLILVFSPNLSKHNSNFENRLREISGSKVEYFVYDTLNPVFKDESYFYDGGHLQTNGAIIFTNDIIDYLRSTPKKNN